MIKLTFTPAIIDQLHDERTQHPHPRVRQRMEAVYLKALGFKHKEIGRIVRISQNTLQEYLQLYQTGGVEALKQFHFNEPKSDLDDYQELLRQEFEKEPPASLIEAAERIEALTKIRRSPTQVGVFMKKLGLQRRKVAQIPAKADVVAQKTFLEESLTPRLEETKESQRHLFFVDAAHFVLQPFLGFLWCFSRIFLKSSPGRQRFNVLGALHATTLQLVTVTNTSYINSESVAQLLRQLAALFTDLPITLVLDNARYQRCRLVQALAAELNIELLFLPPYSPNLNLIERLWKFVKKKCLYSKYYEKFVDFKQAIQECLDQVSGQFKEELASLLTLNFQTFENVSL